MGKAFCTYNKFNFNKSQIVGRHQKILNTKATPPVVSLSTAGLLPQGMCWKMSMASAHTHQRSPRPSKHKAMANNRRGRLFLLLRRKCPFCLCWASTCLCPSFYNHRRQQSFSSLCRWGSQGTQMLPLFQDLTTLKLCSFHKAILPPNVTDRWCCCPP